MTNIVHIPSTAPFIDGLVRALLNGDLPIITSATQPGNQPTSAELANVTLLLPTRRACRMCGEAFLRLSGEKAIVLPTIRPLADGSEDEGLLHEALSDSLLRNNLTTENTSHSLIDMNPAVSSLERHLFLTQAILIWAKSAKSQAILQKESEGGKLQQTKPSQASLMARELSKLIDSSETEEIDLSKLKDLVPDQFSAHWQHTLEFLQIITAIWPDYLQNTNQLSMAARRNIVLNKETERLISQQPENPIIIAGSTGSVPAAARLMKAVANLPNGLIVLPGLDLELDDKAFDELVPNHPEHPQFGLAKLLSDIGVSRHQVKALKGTTPEPAQQALIKFLSEALRPSSSTEKWQHYIANLEQAPDIQADLKSGFKSISLNKARDAQEEAEMIALILRRTADQPSKTAALVTPDRLLARRVAVRLEEWGIKVDDSGGRPLSKTMPGAFFDNIIQALSSGFEPAYLLALLKHPLTRLSFERGDSRLAARALEMAALRQPWLGGGLDGLANTLSETKLKCEQGDHVHPAVKRLKDEEWALAEQLLERLKLAFAPLINAYAAKTEQNLQSFIDAHIEVAEAIALNAEEKSDNLWIGAAGEQLARLLAEILSIQNTAPNMIGRDYPEFYRSLIAGETVRPLTPVHPRIFIWGPFEARLQQTDVVILGGLNEGTWPNAANPSPWLSRPMCQQLGLPAAEQHIGYSAHDFASLISGKEVFLTRADKTDGVQTVPSRWLMRINALLEGLDATEFLNAHPEEPFADWAALRDDTQSEKSEQTRMRAPAPTPPVEARPRHLSVTRIEDWIANPYSIFARMILKLTPLEPLGAPPSAAMRGQIIHEALQIFAEQYPDQLPKDSQQKLSEIAAELMDKISIHPQIGAFWQPRFERFASWFAETEPTRRAGVKQVHTELGGKITIDAPAGPFTLSARADRIDENKDATFHIYDYKTGTVPTQNKVRALYKPQLPLEAAIQQQGGFEGLDKGPVTALSYIAAKGGEPAGEETTLSGDDLAGLIDESMEKLKNLVTSFDQQSTPYKALRRADFKGQYEYDDYAHLARLQEWGAEDEPEDQ